MMTALSIFIASTVWYQYTVFFFLIWYGVYSSPSKSLWMVIEPESTSMQTSAPHTALKFSCIEARNAKALSSSNLIARVLPFAGIEYITSHASAH